MLQQRIGTATKKSTVKLSNISQNSLIKTRKVHEELIELESVRAKIKIRVISNAEPSHSNCQRKIKVVTLMGVSIDLTGNKIECSPHQPSPSERLIGT